MTPEQAQQVLDRLDKLEAFVGSINKSDKLIFGKSVWFKGNKLGFFSTAPQQQSSLTAASIASVSGTLDDTTINNNFASILASLNSIKTGLQTMGLFT